jgi:hypothetical protein
MLLGADKTLVSARWRRRLRAGALAVLFSFYALLPWLHTLTAGAGAEHHGCCHPCVPAQPADAAPAWSAAASEGAHNCWICDSLASLSAQCTPGESASVRLAQPFSRHLARAPEALAPSPVNRACRSQAPPARA